MRSRLLGLLLLASVAAPALAQQRGESVERRIERLEQQLRAVQRRVFPDGSAQFVEPEIGPRPSTGPGGTLSGDALSSLTSRVDALESQLRALTGQVEENGNRTRQLEAEIGRLRTDLTARLDRIDAPAQVAPPPAAPRTETRAQSRSEPAETTTARTTDPTPGTDQAEAAYNAGYRLWNERRYPEAQQALEAAAQQYPNSRWTSWMRNLLGRAYLDESKPATAARVFLANYQDNPRGERAADSLFYLGEALTRLNRRTEACRVYDELASVYPNMRAPLRSGLPAARQAARCAAN